jgi:predicted transcriptional regulator
VKTAISIPDDVFEEAEETAATLQISRSELYTQAIREYLKTRRAANVTASYDAAFADGVDEDAELRRRATRQALLDVAWDEK